MVDSFDVDPTISKLAKGLTDQNHSTFCT